MTTQMAQVAPTTTPVPTTGARAVSPVQSVDSQQTYAKQGPMKPSPEAIRAQQEREKNKYETTKGWSKCGPCMSGMQCFSMGGAGMGGGVA